MARSHEGRSEREAGRQGRTSESRSNLEDRSLDELRQMAGDLNIEGRNRLDRDQLIEEIQRERGSTGQSKGGPSTRTGGTGYEAGSREQGGAPERQGKQSGRQEGSREAGERKGGSQRKRQ